ncbi:Beta-lactamase class C-like and penicillin binding proteins (PBPs) superfamily [hydrothermal vent metagenome]|uniref:Beta-lactamase class C-like and penicillin binding proteins (PBPs) superfamily n=1 Tax=hydrothermal vent metagenome TaxID=652676 RepID=A0A3B1C7I5_9ZZZZ
MRKFKLVLIFSVFFSFVTLQAQTDAEKIDDLISRYHEYGLFNGSALVVKNGNVIFKKGYGYANFEWKVPNTPDAKFRIGSITKQFTATLIMQLVEKGKIKLDGKITDYLPDYRKDTGDKVTIHQLLNHTSGIESYTDMPNVWSDSLRNHYTKEYFIKHFQSGDLQFEPGTEFHYNNTGYYLLAAIIEELTGKPFGEYLKEKILIPVGMKNSGVEDNEIVIEKEASGYMKDGDQLMRDKYLYMPNAMGAGNMYSTVEDMVKWDKALYGNKILSEKSKEKMFTPYLSNYGYGWVITSRKFEETGDSVKVIWHNGGINGFTTLFARLVDDNSMIALFNNTGNSPRTAMAEQIENILYGFDYEYPKRPIGNYLLTVIEDEGIESAIETYNQAKEENEELFDFSEGELNILGYTLLGKEQIDDAIKIFELNVSAYPNSANVYDSMGEAFMKKGENEKAIKNYKKSLELNPGNKNAIAMLKKLGVDYKSKELVVPKEVLKTYAGEYQLMPNFMITIRVDGDKLMAKATGQPEFQIFPISDTKFYYKVVDAQIEFSVNDKNEVESLTLFQGGKELPAKKIK